MARGGESLEAGKSSTGQPRVADRLGAIGSLEQGAASHTPGRRLFELLTAECAKIDSIQTAEWADESADAEQGREAFEATAAAFQSDMLALLKFIASGIARGKIKDVSVVPPVAPGATECDLTTLSEMVRAAIAKAEGR